MTEWEDYYEILGVSPDATPEEIKQAYIYKVNILHPDRLIKASERIRRQAEEDLKRVNRAYNVLRDPTRRREYHSDWVKRKGGGRETPRTKSASPGSARTKDKSVSYSIESLSDAEANTLLRKFAKFRSLVILPFGFLRDARIVESKRVLCRKEHRVRWRIDEQVQRHENVPYSKYARYRRDYADRRKLISYDERNSPVSKYIVPGTESEERCIECHGQGSITCDICHGRGRVTCFRCEGAGQILEREECPRCLGEGRIDTTEIRRRHMPGGRIYEEQIEIESECAKCHGLGYREYLERCYSCRGTGSAVCDACHGSGVIRCHVCEGRGRTYRAMVCSVQTVFEVTKPVWSTGPVPENYMKVAHRGFRKEEDLPLPSDNIAKIQRISWSVPVAYIKYTFAGKTYVLCEVGYGLKKARRKLKFDSYPRSLKKLATFAGAILLVAAVVTTVTVFAAV